MTDLKQAAKMALEALEFSQQMGRSYEIPEYHNEIAPKAMYALRQALDQLPDTTKMIEPSEQDKVDRDVLMYGQGFMKDGKHVPLHNVIIDRGAWADVPDATKWVDELRGDDDLDEPPQPIGEVQIEELGRPYNAGKVVLHFYGEPPPVGTKLYAEPPKLDLLNQTCCECGRSGGYALYCGDCWGKATKREWQGLTWEDYQGMSKELANFAKAIEAKLKEKNT